METEAAEVGRHGDTEKAAIVYQGIEPIQAEDIADLVTFVASRPEHVNVLDMVVMPTAQRSATLTHREPAKE